MWSGFKLSYLPLKGEYTLKIIFVILFKPDKLLHKVNNITLDIWFFFDVVIIPTIFYIHIRCIKLISCKLQTNIRFKCNLQTNKICFVAIFTLTEMLFSFLNF